MSLQNKGCDLVADFLARGGRIRRLPDPEPATFSVVLEYLRSQNITVERVGDGMDPRTRKYICLGKRVDAKKLVSIANALRLDKGFPPFQL